MRAEQAGAQDSQAQTRRQNSSSRNKRTKGQRDSRVGVSDEPDPEVEEEDGAHGKVDHVVRPVAGLLWLVCGKMVSPSSRSERSIDAEGPRQPTRTGYIKITHRSRVGLRSSA